MTEDQEQAPAKRRTIHIETRWGSARRSNSEIEVLRFKEFSNRLQVGKKDHVMAVEVASLPV